jgi:hypothetical protein
LPTIVRLAKAALRFVHRSSAAVGRSRLFVRSEIALWLVCCWTTVVWRLRLSVRLPRVAIRVGFIRDPSAAVG